MDVKLYRSDGKEFAYSIAMLSGSSMWQSNPTEELYRWSIIIDSVKYNFFNNTVSIVFRYGVESFSNSYAQNIPFYCDVNGKNVINEVMSSTKTNKKTKTVTLNCNFDGSIDSIRIYAKTDSVSGGVTNEVVHVKRVSNGHININDIWKNAFIWIKTVLGWRRCIIWKKINGIWKRGK